MGVSFKMRLNLKWNFVFGVIAHVSLGVFTHVSFGWFLGEIVILWVNYLPDILIDDDYEISVCEQ